MSGALHDDGGHRLRAMSDLDTTFLVEASAGTGKTTILIERIVAILKSGRAGLREIAAITFTEKAAGELLLRLRRRLQEEGMEHALRDLPLAPIATIHAFAAELLRESPVEARCDPAFRVTDPAEEDLRLGETWRAWEEEAFGRSDPALEALLRLGTGARELGEAAKRVARHRDVPAGLALECGAAGGESPDALLAREVLPAFQSLAAAIPAWEPHCRDPEDRGLAQMRGIAACWNALAPQGPEAVGRWLLQEGLRKNADGNQANWRDKSQLAAYKERYAGLHALQQKYRASVHHAALAAWLERLRSFLAGYEDRRRGSARLDFQDLLIMTRDLLRDRIEARAAFQRRFRFILVDEFQDTDPLQAEIAFFLAEEEALAADWREARLAPGKLFLVGDPKQSIYRFRRADIEVYEEAREAILAQPEGRGEVLSLTRNFRSAAPLLDWVNAVFSRSMTRPPGDPRIQPDYAPLVPSPRTRDAPGEVRILSGAHLEPGAGTLRAAETMRREARLVAAAARGLVEAGEAVRGSGDAAPRPARWGDMALLLAGTTHLDAFEAALADAGVPFARTGGREFYRRTEIHTVVSLLRALDNPLDTGSLVAALRSPAFGISDQELFEAERAGALAALRGGPPAVEEALATLHALRARRGELAASALLEEALRVTGVATVLEALPGADQRIANLRKVARIARALEREGPVTLRRMARDLTDLFDARSKEAEAACIEEGDDALRIMTVHAAKGLEFPVVFLAGLGATGRGRKRHPRLLADRARGRYTFALRSDVGTHGFKEMERREARIEEAERVRLMYVAATRARNLLYVVDVSGRTQGAARALAAGLPGGPADGEAETAAPPAMRLVRERELPSPPAGSRRRRWEAPAPAADEREVAALREMEERWRARLEAARAAAGAAVAVVRPSRLEARDERDDADETARGEEAEATPEAAAGSRDPEGAPRPSAEARAVGSLVHETLARAFELEDAALRERIRRHSAAAGLSSPAAARAERLVAKALASTIVARARRSPRRLTESPFACWADGALIEGRLDLLFEEEGRLVLVDYKTDDVHAGTIAARAALYRASLAAYAGAARRITGLPVEACLHFIEAGTLVPLDTL